jgi:hypothetical protein
MEFDLDMRQADGRHRSGANPDLGSYDADGGDSLPLRELRRLVGGSCSDCGMPYSARDAVFNLALGL